MKPLGNKGILNFLIRGVEVTVEVCFNVALQKTIEIEICNTCWVGQVYKPVPSHWQKDKTDLIARTCYVAVSQCFYPQL